MISLKVNGEVHQLENVDPDTPLLWVLRDTLGLTGTKYGCGISMCGACTVHMDGEAIRSCTTSLGEVGDSAITTIEGLWAEDREHPVQKAWKQHAVPQCGYCQTGQIMSAAALLSENSEPTDDDIDEAMWGNICRCGTYSRIRAAIHTAAKEAQQGLELLLSNIPWMGRRFLAEVLSPACRPGRWCLLSNFRAPKRSPSSILNRMQVCPFNQTCLFPSHPTAR